MNAEKPLRAIIWCAVSSEEQAKDDKFSLSKQEADARAVAKMRGWTVVDVLRVPGFSRDYVDIHEVAAAHRAEGITAYDDLLKHLQRQDFDILICREGNRLGRTFALFARVADDTIRRGMRIYSLADGMIDESNAGMWIAMGGFTTAGEMKRLREFYQAGSRKNAERGLPTGSTIPISHRVVRGENGQAVRIVVDESKRRLLDDLAEVFLAGTAYSMLEPALYERGHVRQDGRRYGSTVFHNIMHSPIFWGHMARHYTKPVSYPTRLEWLFKLAPPPPQTEIYYDVVEPVYTGEVAAAVQAEMFRRRDIIRGKAAPYKKHYLTGLCICGECKRILVVTSGVNEKPVRTKVIHRGTIKCDGYIRERRNGLRNGRTSPCTQRSVSVNRLLPQIKAVVTKLLEATDESQMRALFDTAGDDTQVLRRLQLVHDEQLEVRETIRSLIRSQAAPRNAAMADMYQEQIDEANDRLQLLLAESQRLQANTQHLHSKAPRQREALTLLRERGVDWIFEQSPTVFNQWLHRLMGEWKFEVLDKEIIGVRTAAHYRLGRGRSINRENN